MLTAARDLLKRKKWIRGNLARISGVRGAEIMEVSQLIACPDKHLIGVCAVGAIIFVSGRANVDRYLDKIEPAMNARGTDRRAIIDWNDDEAKSKQDVIKLFNEAIAQLGKRLK